MISKQTFPVTVTEYADGEPLVAKLDFLNKPADILNYQMRKSVNPFDDEYLALCERVLEHGDTYNHSNKLIFSFENGFPNILNLVDEDNLKNFQFVTDRIVYEDIVSGYKVLIISNISCDDLPFLISYESLKCVKDANIDLLGLSIFIARSYIVDVDLIKKYVGCKSTVLPSSIASIKMKINEVE